MSPSEAETTLTEATNGVMLARRKLRRLIHDPEVPPRKRAALRSQLDRLRRVTAVLAEQFDD
jgi:hypothetical protein